MSSIANTMDRQATAAQAAWLLNAPGRAADALDEIGALISSGLLDVSAWSWGVKRLTLHLRAMAYGVA